MTPGDRDPYANTLTGQLAALGDALRDMGRAFRATRVGQWAERLVSHLEAWLTKGDRP